MTKVQDLLQEGRFRQALALAQQEYEASGDDSACAYWIGVAYAKCNRMREAEPWLKRALAANPFDARAHAALAFVGKALGYGPARVTHYRRAIELAPNDPDLRANCAEALLEGGEIEAARRELRAGLMAAPGHTLCTLALARTLVAGGAMGEAIDLLERCAARSTERDVRWLLADCYLRAGRYREGFDAYEVRRQRSSRLAHVAEPKLSKPEWKGEPLAGRRLLVLHEQGLGDTIQSLRYAATLAAQGVKVSAVVVPALQRLLVAQPFLEKVYLTGEPIPRNSYDCWCLVMSLPRLLGEDGSGKFAKQSYLRAPPRDISFERAGSHLHVGLCWSGSAANPNDTLRSIPPERFAPLAEIAGVRLVSCQYGAEPSALPAFIRPPSRPIVDLADTAALIVQLDLLVSVDSAPAHLAAAMGREVWLLARWNGDWRWGDSGSTTHWYPAMRLLRQPGAGDWGSVIERAKIRLEERERPPGS